MKKKIVIFDALVDVTGPEMSLKLMRAERWENPNPNGRGSKGYIYYCIPAAR